MQLRRRRRHSHQGGQGITETAFVLSLTLLLIIGVLIGGLIFYQAEGVNDGARGGARAALISTNLYSPYGNVSHCESGQPDSIVHQVTLAVNQLPVNQARLCAISAQELQQMPVNDNVANIVVDAYPSLANPHCVTVTVVYKTHPIAIPYPRAISLDGHSSIRFFAGATGAATPTASASPTPNLLVDCPNSATPNASLTAAPG